MGRLIRLIRAGEFDTVFSFLVHANCVAAAASAVCGEVRLYQCIQTTVPRPRWRLVGAGRRSERPMR